jgi:hypothetical protein
MDPAACSIVVAGSFLPDRPCSWRHTVGRVIGATTAVRRRDPREQPPEFRAPPLDRRPHRAILTSGEEFTGYPRL